MTKPKTETPPTFYISPDSKTYGAFQLRTDDTWPTNGKRLTPEEVERYLVIKTWEQPE